MIMIDDDEDDMNIIIVDKIEDHGFGTENTNQKGNIV